MWIDACMHTNKQVTQRFAVLHSKHVFSVYCRALPICRSNSTDDIVGDKSFNYVSAGGYNYVSASGYNYVSAGGYNYVSAGGYNYVSAGGYASKDRLYFCENILGNDLLICELAHDTDCFVPDSSLSTLDLEMYIFGVFTSSPKTCISQATVNE